MLFAPPQDARDSSHSESTSFRSSLTDAMGTKSMAVIKTAFGMKKSSSFGGLRASAMEHALKGVPSTRKTHKPWIDKHGGIVWSMSRIRAYQVVHTKTMDAFMMLITIANIVLIIYETDEEALCYPKFNSNNVSQCPSVPENKPWLQIVNWSILIIYSLEALLRYYAERCSYLKSKVNLVDLFICLTDWASRFLGSMFKFKLFRIFRVFRLCRAIRIVKFIPELNALAMGFSGSMRAMLFGSCLLLLLLMFCSILLVQFVHPVTSRLKDPHCDRCSRGYASVLASTLTLFQSIVAGDSWGSLSIPAIEEQWYSGTLLIFTKLLIGVGAMNLILAIIVDKAVEAREKNKEHVLSERMKDSRRRRKEMLHIFHEMDSDESGTLDSCEIEEALSTNPRFIQMLRLADLRDEDIDCILDILHGADNGGEIKYKDFCDILELFQAADMRKTCVITNMMLSDLRRQLKADYERKLSTICNLVIEIKEKLDTVVLDDSMSAKPQKHPTKYSLSVKPQEHPTNDSMSAKPQKHPTNGFGAKVGNGDAQSPRSEILPRPHRTEEMNLKAPLSFEECAPDVLHQLGAELVDLERGSLRRQEWLLRDLDTSFQDLEFNLCASQQSFLKAAWLAHVQKEHGVAHSSDFCHQAGSETVDARCHGSCASPRKDDARYCNLSPGDSRAGKRNALEFNDPHPLSPGRHPIWL